MLMYKTHWKHFYFAIYHRNKSFETRTDRAVTMLTEYNFCIEINCENCMLPYTYYLHITQITELK